MNDNLKCQIMGLLNSVLDDYFYNMDWRQKRAYENVRSYVVDTLWPIA